VKDYRTEDFHFQREAKRVHRLERLEFEEPVEPLKPLWPLVVAGVVFAALLAAAFIWEVSL
jgi:hypothetical protein